MTVPVFTPTPVIPGTGAADMPAALGPQIGAVTDQNFGKVGTWGDSLETELSVKRYELGAVGSPAANFAFNSSMARTIRGPLVTVYFSIARTGGTALVSGANGTITSVNVCTLAGVPPFGFFFPLRCIKGPILNCVLSTAGVLSIRGCSALSFTFPTTWTVEGQLMWIGG